jgi:hypothetical protein
MAPPGRCTVRWVGKDRADGGSAVLLDHLGFGARAVDLEQMDSKRSHGTSGVMAVMAREGQAG